MDPDEALKHLAETTGLSYVDLIQRLQKLTSSTVNPGKSEQSTSLLVECESTQSNQETQEENVANKTKDECDSVYKEVEQSSEISTKGSCSNSPSICKVIEDDAREEASNSRVNESQEPTIVSNGSSDGKVIEDEAEEDTKEEASNSIVNESQEPTIVSNGSSEGKVIEDEAEEDTKEEASNSIVNESQEPTVINNGSSDGKVIDDEAEVDTKEEASNSIVDESREPTVISNGSSDGKVIEDEAGEDSIEDVSNSTLDESQAHLEIINISTESEEVEDVENLAEITKRKRKFEEVAESTKVENKLDPHVDSTFIQIKSPPDVKKNEYIFENNISSKQPLSSSKNLKIIEKHILELDHTNQWFASSPALEPKTSTLAVSKNNTVTSNTITNITTSFPTLNDNKNDESENNAENENVANDEVELLSKLDKSIIEGKPRFRTSCTLPILKPFVNSLRGKHHHNSNHNTEVSSEYNLDDPEPELNEKNSVNIPISRQLSSEVSDNEETHSMETLEDLRNNLKLQLDSLRMRKKNIFPTALSTKIIDNIECSKKLFLLEAKDSTETTSTPKNTDINIVETSKIASEEATNNTETCLKDEQVYTQTGNLGFIIAEVQGGVQIDESPESHVTSKENRNSTDEVEDIRVFDQIRNIINKSKTKYTEISHNSYAKIDPERQLNNPEEGKTTNESVSLEYSQYSSSEATDVDEKSPFVSNSLDKFLTSSQLNISYQVPKLGAEESLQKSNESDSNFENEIPSPLVLKKVTTIRNRPFEKLKKTPLIKAKTVAQKRKLLERERKRELKELEKMKIKEEQEKEVNKIENKVEIKEVVRRDGSYVLFNDSKIWVKSYSHNTCVARINCSRKSKNSLMTPRRRKLSLLNQGQKNQSTIRYLPGPLSKKQLIFNEQWETYLLKLPQIILEVQPKIGERFSDDVLHRFSSLLGGDLDENTIEFALSMVQTEGDNQQQEKQQEPFKFPLKYNNKAENVIVRRRKTVVKVEKAPEIKPSTNPVADVIENLIKYVEIKELAPSLIKEDDSQKKVEQKLDNLLSPVIENNVSVFKKPTKKRSKIELELLRLNCKVVNVEVEEAKEVPCTEPFCKMGCVCKSLKCEYIPTYHCQKLDCMFKCTCPNEKPLVYNKVTLPAGTNILSEDAMIRIEDEAKKNLAKMEREFTQTVIHTNNKTIVVGIGNRMKTRRSTKAPVKYTDFVDSREPICTEEKLASRCTVNLTKLDLSKLIPYCLFHKNYNCFCKGKATVQSTKNTPEKDTLIKLPKTNYLTLKTSISDVESIENSSNSNDSLSFSKRPVRNIKKRSYSDFSDTFSDINDESSRTMCRRSKPMLKKYLKSYRYTKDVTKMDFANTATFEQFQRLEKLASSGELSEAELLKISLVEERFKRPVGTSKRKQVLLTRSEDVPVFVEKVVKEDQLSETSTRNNNGVAPAPAPVFDGEIIIDEQNMDLLKKMGPKTVADGYARLLPWPHLIRGFHSNCINIWCMANQPTKLLINKSDKRCPKNFVPISRATQITEVISWILDNKLPDTYQADSLSFILKETKDNFEICGICTKNISINLKSEKLSEPVKTETCNSTPSSIDTFQNANVLSIGKKLVVVKENNLAVQRLGPIDNPRHVNLIDNFVRLPLTDAPCKWRMIYLNSEFAFLYFKNSATSIRYKDLFGVSQISRKYNNTISLKCKDSKKDLFGIYFDPTWRDRIYVGPYDMDDSEDNVQTLRYINQRIISTENFNKLRGKDDYKCGYWLTSKVMKSAQKATPPESSTVIDLTSESESLGEFKAENEMNCRPPIIVHNNKEIKIIEAPPRKPEDFNRYIITNIPHFGYLGAFMNPSGEIDVSWPFENKLLRFEDEHNAIMFLQERFSSLLQCVPETFTITVIASHNIDLELYKPINSNVLNGHHICGEFGCFNIMLLNDKECQQKVGCPKEDVLKLFENRARNFVKKKIEYLADILKIPQTIKYDLNHVLKKATTEINIEKQKELNYIEYKTQLYRKKRVMALAIHKILTTLPPAQRNAENLKFRAIIQKTEPIEIHDSDDESSRNSTDTMEQQVLQLSESPPCEPSMSYKMSTKINLNPKGYRSILKKSQVATNESSVDINNAKLTKTASILKGNLQPEKDSKLKVATLKNVKLMRTPTGYKFIIGKDYKNCTPLQSETLGKCKEDMDVDSDSNNSTPGSSTRNYLNATLTRSVPTKLIQNGPFNKLKLTNDQIPVNNDLKSKTFVIVDNKVVNSDSNCDASRLNKRICVRKRETEVEPMLIDCDDVLEDVKATINDFKSSSCEIIDLDEIESDEERVSDREEENVKTEIESTPMSPEFVNVYDCNSINENIADSLNEDILSIS
ncbi:unnamed protein product [Phyllotreta striolata]|uniref:MGA conserved domain-containing protein n=1 Tax=Phyllotreta striolata TaxID=444603 RepID=A0A9P0E074_PHYSR|nr:unnamed protein product [Phyllotreta striolata]